MSGHNPHSRVSQPVNSTSWNHLQVPAYIPRQPQLAHMASERSMHSTPMMWPNTPTNPADAYLNFMALQAAAAAVNTNHKNSALDINSLLPFVRSATSTLPMNSSMDLSMQPTGSCNSMAPSPRNFLPNAGNHVHKPTFDANEMPYEPMAIDDQRTTDDSSAFFTDIPDQMPSNKSNTNASSTNAYYRDSNVANDLPNYLANRNEKQQNEPVKLIKESNAAAAMPNLSDTDNPNQSTLPLQQLFGLSLPNSSTSVTPNINDLSKSLFSIFKNASSQPSSNIPLQMPLPAHPNFSSSVVPKPASNASNDDSLDSMASTCNGNDKPEKMDNPKKTRRRKQQKTVRLSNESAQMDIDNDSSPKDEPDKNSINMLNGSNFLPFSTDYNNLALSTQQPIPETNASITSSPIKQTQSIDLSHGASGSGGQDAFLNGCTKLDDLMKTSGDADGSTNGLPRTDDLMSSSNLFLPLNFLKGANTTIPNEMNIFPTADSLEKGVDKLDKCNESNGFDGLTDSNTKLDNKLSIDTHTDIIAPIPTANLISSANCNSNGGELSAMTKENECDEAHEKKHEIPNDTPISVESGAKTKSPETTIDEPTSVIHMNDADNLFCDQKEENSVNEGASEATCTLSTENETNAQESTMAVERNEDKQCDSNEIEITGNENAATEEITSIPTNTVSPQKRPENAKELNNSRPRGKTKTGGAKRSRARKSGASSKAAAKTIPADTSKVKKIVKEQTTAFRGPYVHVSNDGNSSVINTPLNEEAGDKQKSSNKNFEILAASERNKLRGLHVSTLSNKYDADTRDKSWVCVFCKMGPHKYGLGDLFGPFIVSTESDEYYTTLINARADLPSQHTSKARGSAMHRQNASSIAPKYADLSKKRRIDSTANNTAIAHCSTLPPSDTGADASDIFSGMIKVNDTDYEVWVHEDCVVWAPGVYLIASRVVGLEVAVWSYARTQCTLCQQYGAMIQCIERHCKLAAHVPCAKRHDWLLNEDEIDCRCTMHKGQTNEPTSVNKPN